MAEFLVYRTEQGEFHWYLVGDNGSMMAGSEKSYETMERCTEAIALVKDIAPGAAIVDRTKAESISEAQRRARQEIKRPILVSNEPILQRRSG